MGWTWGDVKELAAIFLVAIVIFVVLGSAVLGIANIASAKSCRETTAIMGVTSKYSIWTGCMIEFGEGRWVSLERYQAIVLGK